MTPEDSVSVTMTLLQPSGLIYLDVLVIDVRCAGLISTMRRACGLSL